MIFDLLFFAIVCFLLTIAFAISYRIYDFLYRNSKRFRDFWDSFTPR